MISHIAGCPYIKHCCFSSPMPTLCIKALSLLVFKLFICCCTLASNHDLIGLHKCPPDCQDFANTYIFGFLIFCVFSSSAVGNARYATMLSHSTAKWHQAWYRCMWAVGSSSGWSTPRRQFSGNSPWVSQSRGPPSTTSTRVSVPARRPPPLKREYSGSRTINRHAVCIITKTVCPGHQQPCHICTTLLAGCHS